MQRGAARRLILPRGLISCSNYIYIHFIEGGGETDIIIYVYVWASEYRVKSAKWHVCVRARAEKCACLYIAGVAGYVFMERSWRIIPLAAILIRFMIQFEGERYNMLSIGWDVIAYMDAARSWPDKIEEIQKNRYF